MYKLKALPEMINNIPDIGLSLSQRLRPAEIQWASVADPGFWEGEMVKWLRP